MALALALLVCCGCGDQAAPLATPSPTIAVLARRSPTPGAPAALALSPTAARPPATQAVPLSAATQQEATPAPLETFVYLWPSYLPADAQVSPKESRVPRAGETGRNAPGFYIVTFAVGGGKLVIGGGATETLPLSGDQRRIAVGGRQATLTTGAAGRQVVFDVPRGSLFVYSSTLSEEELLRVAGSLQPIELTELRERVGAE